MILSVSLFTRERTLSTTASTKTVSRRVPVVVENPRAVSYENDPRYAAALRPVTAYAPADPNGPSEVLAGRGLY